MRHWPKPVSCSSNSEPIDIPHPLDGQAIRLGWPQAILIGRGTNFLASDGAVEVVVKRYSMHVRLHKLWEELNQ